MPGGFGRINSLGSPFRMVDSGYTDSDKENNSLFQEGIDKYIAQLEESVELNRSMYTTITKYSPLIYPLVAGVFTFSVLTNYTRPKAIYMRGIGTAVALYAGVWTSLRQMSRVDDIFLMKNYKHFNQDMRNALATGDARYLREYYSEKK